MKKEDLQYVKTTGSSLTENPKIQKLSKEGKKTCDGTSFPLIPVK